MCGIAGIFRTDPSKGPADAGALPGMLDAMATRGPDSRGSLRKGAMTFGMVRLSIIGVEGGDQPIFNETGKIAVILNGELYNYVELRAELERAGHRFTTRTDTETLVHGYEEWGIEGILSRLRGMFAFALHDESSGTLYLARDRFGIKPLFCHAGANGVFFASDLLGLTAHPDVPRELHPPMLSTYLSIGYPAGPETFYRGIVHLEPAHYVAIRSGRWSDPSRYWRMSYPAAGSANPITEQDALAELSRRLEESVLLHQRSDVPYGAFLSGGLDSASVVSIMASKSDRKFRTFSIGFEEDGFDESVHAAAIARHYGVPNDRIILGVPSEDELRDTMSRWDQPHYDFSCIPTLAVARLARPHVKVVLTGDGGDELFAGYPTHFLHKLVGPYNRLPGFLRRRVIEPLVQALPASYGKLSLDYKLKQFVRGASGDFRRAHYGWKVLFSEEEKAALLAPELSRAALGADPFEIFGRCFAEASNADRLNQLLHVDARTFLQDDCLYKVDRMTMAASLEARVPFLDHTLWEFAAGLPPALKQPGLKTKWLLRRLMRDRLPPGITKLPKGGFTPPINRWLRGPLRPALRRIILDSPSLREHFRPAPVEALVREHAEGAADHSRRLWAIAAFLLWRDRQAAVLRRRTQQ